MFFFNFILTKRSADSVAFMVGRLRVGRLMPFLVVVYISAEAWSFFKGPTIK